MIFRSFRENIFRGQLAEGTSSSAAFRTLYNPSRLTGFPVSPNKQELQVDSRHSLATETEINQ